MKELSLHILDIIQNSIVAGAPLIELDLTEQERGKFESSCRTLKEAYAPLKL